MGLEHVGEAKSLATHITWIGLLSCVSSAVSLHVWAASKAFATDFTDKGLLSCKTNTCSSKLGPTLAISGECCILYEEDYVNFDQNKDITAALS